VSAEVATNRQVEPFDSKRTWIRFAGPPQTLRSYSFSDVLQRARPTRGLPPPGGRRRHLGGAAEGRVDHLDHEPLADVRPEVQAMRIATVLDGLPLTSPGAAWTRC
jgi:hypothetical protein